MLRRLLYSGMFAVLPLLTGCTMCCHPYDNGGPVYDESCNGGIQPRVGSVLENGPQPTVTLAKPTLQSQTQTQARARARAKVQAQAQARARSRAMMASNTARNNSRGPSQYQYGVSTRNQNTLARNQNTLARNQMRHQVRSSDVARKDVRGQSRYGDVARKDTRGQSRHDDTARATAGGQSQPGDVAGSEKIISVTDRVVGSSKSSEESTETASAGAPAESVRETSESESREATATLPSSGWTARRPTTEVQR